MKATNQAGGEGKPRRHYDETYKRQAAQLSLQANRTIRAIAQELGVSESMLYEWRRRYGAQVSVPGNLPQTLGEANQEIARLRELVERLQERELVLKKSLGILSETPGRGMPGSRR